MPAFSAEQVNAGVTLSAADQLQANIVRGAIGASVETTIGGGDFGDALTDSMLNAAVQTVGAVAVLVAGGDGQDVKTGAQIASSAALNNYLTHTQLKSLASELKQCGTSSSCKDLVQDRYYKLSLEQEHQLAECGSDLTCQAPHLREIYQTRVHRASIEADFKAIGGVRAFDNGIWIVQNNAIGLLDGGQYYSEYKTWASQNCSSTSGSACYRSFMQDAKWDALRTGAELAATSTAVVALGGSAVAIAPAALASARVCIANPLCWNQAGIAAAEIAVGDALGGGQLLNDFNKQAKIKVFDDNFRVRGR